MEPESSPLDDGISWSRPSARLASLRGVEVVAGTAAAALLAFGILAGSVSLATAALAAGLVVLAGVGLGWLLSRRVGAWGYAEREDDLLVRRGVLFRRLSVIPYGRMQYVDVTAGPFERAFGLATVRMHTAAAASDA